MLVMDTLLDESSGDEYIYILDLEDSEDGYEMQQDE